MINKITLVGHCQYIGLCYFLNKIYPNIETKLFLPKKYRKTIWYNEVPSFLEIEEHLLKSNRDLVLGLSDTDALVTFSANCKGGILKCSKLPLKNVKNAVSDNCKVLFFSGFYETNGDKNKKQKALIDYEKKSNQSINPSDFLDTISIYNQFEKNEMLYLDENNEYIKSAITSKFYIEIIKKIAESLNLEQPSDALCLELSQEIFPYNKYFYEKRINS